MNANRRVLLAASFVCAAAFTAWSVSAKAAGEKTEPGAATLTEEDRAALEVGRRVLAVQRAIEHSGAPESLDAVKALGLDTRYFVMVRGWLAEQLRADASIRDATKNHAPQRIKDRIAFLEKAMRAIDLER